LRESTFEKNSSNYFRRNAYSGLTVSSAALSLKVVALRAGVAASPQQPDEVLRALDYMLANRERLAIAAQVFAERYRKIDPANQIERLLDRFEALLSPQA
jgi:hypothetical protein